MKKKYDFKFNPGEISNYSCYDLLSKYIKDNKDFEILNSVSKKEFGAVQNRIIYLDNIRGTGVIASSPGFAGREADVVIVGEDSKTEETFDVLEKMCKVFSLKRIN
jgi:hypothetical protein